MTGLCLDCSRPSHTGCNCDGLPLLLLDPIDDPPSECISCGWGSRVTERCVLCRCEEPEPVALARVMMPALDELMRRRQLSADPRRTMLATAPCVHGPQGSILADVYAAARTPGVLAALGLALGSLAPLAAMLGGWS